MNIFLHASLLMSHKHSERVELIYPGLSSSHPLLTTIHNLSQELILEKRPCFSAICYNAVSVKLVSES